MSVNAKTLIGALVAAVLAVAVYYGAMSRQTADNLQSQADRTLGASPTSTAPRQPVPPAPPSPATQPATPADPGPQTTAPVPQQR